VIELLAKLIGINSIFPHERECGEFLYHYLLDLGFKTEKQFLTPERFNLLAEKGEGEKAFLLYAHLDTVPIYGQWHSDPFSTVINGDRLTGLGSTDMKGGLVAILEAVKDFVPRGYRLKVAFGVDEENYSAGAFHLADSGWLKDVQGVLVPESSLPFHRSPLAGRTISIGRKGRCVFLIRIFGRSAHGVNKTGINALEEGAKLILFLHDFFGSESPQMGKTSFFVRRFEGKSLSLSIPDYAELELDFHLVIPDSSEILKQKLQSFLRSFKTEARLEVSLADRPTPYLEPFVIDKENQFLQLISAAVKEVYGDFYYNYGQSVGDENVFGALGLPVFTLGPLGDNHHTADEWVSIESLEKLSRIYRLILERLNSG